MYKKMTLSAVLVLLCCNAMAEQDPKGFKSDVRIKRYVYDENNVYKLKLHMKSVTALQFAEGEIVESILIGDSASWEIVKLNKGNVISVKPVIDKALTNMTVYTDKRVYTFELLSDGDIKPGMQAGASQAFRTVFIYPEEKKVPDKNLVKGGPIDMDYLVAGLAPFRPVRIQDNTLQTTFFLPQGAPRPAVFKVGGDRQEKLVNSRTDGNKIVVDGVSDFWVLRIGDEMICVGRTNSVRKADRVRTPPAS